MNPVSIVLSMVALVAVSISDAAAPNVVLILADDMGVDSVGAFNDKLGLPTPALDRLVGEGMHFTDAHSTSSVCSPTRYSVLTGRYSWRSRLKRGIVGVWQPPLIKAERLTLPEMFQAHDYSTAMIGKWHLGWNWAKKGGGTTDKLAEIDFAAPAGGGPIDHGFDYYYGDDVPNWPPYAWRENDRLIGDINSKMKAGAMVGVSAGPAVKDWDFRAVLDEYGRRCDKYIRGQAEAESPFFLYVPMPSPHTPIAPHASFQGRTGISEYADFLVQTDAVVGKILKSLDESGQADDTIVLFTCDNGTSPKADFPGLEDAGVYLRNHWRGWKADAYEGGHRVPFIVRWPDKIQANSQCDESITVADIMSTLAGVLGHRLPANAGEDSVSLLPVLLGESTEPLHEVVVHHSVSGHFAVRSGKWKLLLCRGSGGWSPPRERDVAKSDLPDEQLYDLASDPKETRNRRDDHPEIVAELKTRLRQIVEQGRSTPGPIQPNHQAAIWWQGLPWPKPTE